MITEDYVSLETAKLLKEKGFDERCFSFYWPDGSLDANSHDNTTDLRNSTAKNIVAPTLQMAMKWLREVHKVVLVVDYEYECTDTSYYYKIYKLGEYGKPESVAVTGVSYDENNNPTEHIVGFRDYSRGKCEYATYEEACEEGIKSCLENLI